jgi:hypothetical protein
MRRGFSLRQVLREKGLNSSPADYRLAQPSAWESDTPRKPRPANQTTPRSRTGLSTHIYPNFALWQHFGNASSLCWA